MFPNTELAVRNWLRTQSVLTDVLTTAATTAGVPVGSLIDLEPHRTLPCVVVYRAGGTPDPYIPLDRAALGFDCWGTARSRGVAMNLQGALLGALTSMASEPLGDGVFGYNALIESALWSPDPGGRSRYVITAVVTARRQSALAG